MFNSGMFSNLFNPAENSLLSGYTSRTSAKKTAHWMPALMLAWTFWTFATPLFSTADSFPHWMWPTLASFATFLCLYYRVYYCDRTQIFWCTIGMAMLGFVVTPFNPGAQGYIIYACAYFAFAGPMRTVIRNFAILLVLYSCEWLFVLHYDWPYLLNALLVSLAVTFMNVNFLRKQQGDAQLKLSHDEVRRLAALAERERIGRDLHDLLGHTLSLITLKTELANRLFDRDIGAAKREMADVERIARDALAQVRRAVTGIRAAGIVAELAAAKLLLEAQGVRFEYACAEMPLDVAVETVLAMVVREATTNIRRHAQATSAKIELSVQRQMLLMRIRDDGRGGAIVPGNGLSGMRERLATIDGVLQIHAVSGGGTTLEINVPLPMAVEIAPQLRIACSA